MNVNMQVSASLVLENDVANNGKVTFTLSPDVNMALVDVAEINKGALTVGQNKLTPTSQYLVGLGAEEREVDVFNKQGVTWPKGTLLTLSVLSLPQDVYMTATVAGLAATFTMTGDAGGIVLFGDGHIELVPANSTTAAHTYGTGGTYAAMWVRPSGLVVVCPLFLTAP